LLYSVGRATKVSFPDSPLHAVSICEERVKGIARFCSVFNIYFTEYYNTLGTTRAQQQFIITVFLPTRRQAMSQKPSEVLDKDFRTSSLY